ncbi:hypothetical protein Tfer_0124 [Thermincola ferriacetica]|uniref:Peptidase M50 n=1 Tax=Thermincola ferriacetica TaxID=281456 RepID=A0A0L6W6A4_9FIRM|nr:hypothetical protein [Thermincola ferriacetica]KNZ71050.1 hypothetical protein Tfer_0124 [Thermincola ferriacetica]
MHHFVYNLIIIGAAFVLFLIGSTFLHELSHYVAARLAGFKIVGYQLWTIPFKRRGYVDVFISRHTKKLMLKKGFMHGSGLMVHLIILIIALFAAYHSSVSWGRAGWLTGAFVNAYLFLLNLIPEESDGRKLIALFKARA